MENITKALYMAAGVLIGILILTAFVWVFSNGGKFLASFEDSGDIKQVEQFNAELLAYQKEDNTIYDVISVINKAKDINAQNLFDQTNSLKIEITGIYELDTTNNYDKFNLGIGFTKLTHLIEEYGKTTENDTSYNYQAYFEGEIRYNTKTGKINLITFTLN